MKKIEKGGVFNFEGSIYTIREHFKACDVRWIRCTDARGDSKYFTINEVKELIK